MRIEYCYLMIAMKYVVIAFYKFFPIEEPLVLKDAFQRKCKASGIVGSIIISPEGINGTVSGQKDGVRNLIKFLQEIPNCSDIEFKESYSDFSPFLRMKVKIKKEIVTIGLDKVKPHEFSGTYIEAEDWNNIVQSEDYVIIDTRNDYEVGIGTFKNSINPKIKSFREFPLWWEKNKEKYQSKKVAMFCTGGIRCEKSTNYILQSGFEEVVHLKGGILKYLETVGESQSLWEGACFVFDQRVSVMHGLVEGPQILCHACRRPVEVEDTHHTNYKEGVSCKNCFTEHNEERKKRFKERQKQIGLANERGYRHIGRLN